MVAGFLVPVLAAAWAPGEMPVEARRGRAIFFESEAGSRCANCHVMEGKGTPAGPDLARMAVLNAKALKMSVLSTLTQYVVTVKLKSGERFPAMKVSDSGAGIKVYDLTSNPPVEKVVPPAQFDRFESNTSWKHPPESAGLAARQLADLFTYLRFTVTGDRRPVKPEEVE